MSDTGKQKLINWRGTPMTIGMLVALATLIVGITTVAVQAKDMVNEAAQKAATQAVINHTQRPVDVSHADLPKHLKQYTPQVEFRLGVEQIRSDIRMLKKGQEDTADAIKDLSDQVKRANGRRRSRRTSP